MKTHSVSNAVPKLHGLCRKKGTPNMVVVDIDGSQRDEVSEDAYALWNNKSPEDYETLPWCSNVSGGA